MRTADPELHKKRREEILTSAIRCFSRRGFHKTSMKEICVEAHMSPGNLYRYYASKEDIIKDACDLQACQLLDEMSRAGNHNDTARMISAASTSYIRKNCDPETAHFTYEVWAEAARNPEIRDYLAQSDREVQKQITQLLTQAQRSKRISTRVDPVKTAQTIAVLAMGYPSRAVINPDFDPETDLDIIHQTIEALLSPSRDADENGDENGDELMKPQAGR